MEPSAQLIVHAALGHVGQALVHHHQYIVALRMHPTPEKQGVQHRLRKLHARPESAIGFIKFFGQQLNRIGNQFLRGVLIRNTGNMPRINFLNNLISPALDLLHLVPVLVMGLSEYFSKTRLVISGTGGK